MAKIKLTVSSNFQEASAQMQGFSDLTEKELKRIKTAMGKIKGDEIESFVQKNQRAANAVRATRGPVEALKAETTGLRKKMEALITNGMDPMSNEMKTLRTQYEKTTRQIEIQNRALKASKDITKAAGVALKYLAVASLAAGAASSKMAMDYTKSIANVNTMIDMSASDFKSLDKEITATSNAFAIQKTELSAGVYQALSAGAKDLGSAMDIVTNSAILGKGALIDNKSAVDIVTTAMNAYSSEALSAAEVSDTYFQIIKKGKINGEELSATIGQSISLFAAAKIPVDDLGAGIASLTKVGVQSSQATTQLNGIVNAFLKPSAAMSAALKKVGVESGSALLEQEGLGGAIEFLKDATGGSIDKMAELIPNIRGMRGAVALAADDMSVYNEVAESFNNKTGAANEAMEKQTEGFAKNAFTVDQSIVILKNLATTLGETLLPAIGAAANALNNFVTDQEKMKKTLNVILPILGGVAAGLASFLILTKVIAVVKGFSIAMKALNLAMKANPAILIAMSIAAVVAAIVVLIRNWDTFVVFFQTTIEKISTRASQFATNIRIGWSIAFKAIGIVVLELTEIIFDKLMGGINKFLDLAGKLPFIGDKFKILQENVNGVAVELKAAKAEAVENSKAMIDSQKAELAAVNEASAGKIEKIKEESAARMEALKEQEAVNLEAHEAAMEQTQLQEEAKTELLAIALQDRIAVLNDIEAQANIDNMATFQEFLDGRMAQENVSGDQRILFLQKELKRIKGLETLSNKEKLAAEKQVNKMILAEKAKALEAKKALMTAELQATSELFGAVSGLITAFAGENRAAAITAKALAHAQAAINSYLAFTQVLADPTLPFFLKAISAASTLASGLAQQANIAKTPIPSAQTGTGKTGIEVSRSGTSSQADNVPVMVSAGETVSVGARGESGGSTGTMNLSVMVDDEAIFRVVNIGIESGDIRITNDNIQGGISA